MGQWVNRLFHGDSLEVISQLMEELRGRVRLIYIDPPFYTGTDYSIRRKKGGSAAAAPAVAETATFSDRWDGGLGEYISFLRERLEPIREILSETGSLWLHLDWHVSHYAKVMADEIFGRRNFVNEIIWRRTNSPKAQSVGLGSQHDTILLYARDRAKFRLKPIYREHDAHSLRPYRYRDERGRFRLIEIEAHGIQRSASRRQFEWRGRTAPYLYKRETLEKWWREGLIYRSRNGRYSKKQYLDETRGVPVSDLWLDIPPLQGASAEYTGFLTQKPAALLRRIIECASDPGDIVADFFVGSGTTAVVAQELGRPWVACDISEAALVTTQERLLSVSDSTQFTVIDLMARDEEESSIVC